jgi:vitamin B12 transporter
MIVKEIAASGDSGPRKRKNRLSLMLLAAGGVLSVVSGASAPLYGETESKSGSKGEKVVISPYRRQGSVSQSGSAISVIDAETIDRTGSQTVAELLRRVPGVEVVQAGGSGRTTTVFLRGAESDQTLILIDGVRVNTVADGSFDFADLRVDNIERIEILKGAQSVLYGSDALGGVISIFTNRGHDGDAVTLKAEGGSYSSQDYTVRGSVHNGRVTSSTALSFLSTQGISAAAPRLGNTEADGYENLTLSSSNDVQVGSEWKATLNGRLQRGDTQLDGFDFLTGPIDDLNFTQRHQLVTGQAAVNRTTGIVRPSLMLAYMYDQLNGFDADTAYNAYNIRNASLSPTLQVDVVPNDWSFTTIGTSFDSRSAANPGNFDRSRSIFGTFLNQQFDLGKHLSISGGVRYDHYSDFGDQVTYRTTLSSSIDDLASRLHTSFGTGFKAPTFNELYFPQFGNANLSTEKNRGFDVGVETRLLDGRVTHDLTFFRSDYSDLISFNTADFTAQNIESSVAKGFEESLEVMINNAITLTFGYTYTDSVNNSTDTMLPRRPLHRFTTGVILKPVEDLTIDLLYLMVKDRIESDLKKMDDYERVNATIRYTGGTINPYVRVVNLFDTRYEEIVGYGTPGLSVFGGIEIPLT